VACRTGASRDRWSIEAEDAFLDLPAVAGPHIVIEQNRIAVLQLLIASMSSRRRRRVVVASSDIVDVYHEHRSRTQPEFAA
jgi:hypothetical protein